MLSFEHIQILKLLKMREKKKSLKLRKFKVASLRTFRVIGGTNSNPCNNTQQSGISITECPTHDYTCGLDCDDDTTTTYKKTSPEHPCRADNNDSFQTGPNCP